MKFSTDKPIDPQPTLTRRNRVMDAMIDAFAAQMKREARTYGIESFDNSDLDHQHFSQSAVRNASTHSSVVAALDCCFAWNRKP